MKLNVTTLMFTAGAVALVLLLLGALGAFPGGCREGVPAQATGRCDLNQKLVVRDGVAVCACLEDR